MPTIREYRKTADILFYTKELTHTQIYTYIHIEIQRSDARTYSIPYPIPSSLNSHKSIIESTHNTPPPFLSYKNLGHHIRDHRQKPFFSLSLSQVQHTTTAPLHTHIETLWARVPPYRRQGKKPRKLT